MAGAVGAMVAALTALNPHKYGIKKLMVTLLTTLVVNNLWIYSTLDHVYGQIQRNGLTLGSCPQQWGSHYYII